MMIALVEPDHASLSKNGNVELVDEGSKCAILELGRVERENKDES